MNKRKHLTIHLLFALLFILISLALYYTITTFGAGSGSGKIKIGFILDGDIKDNGWNQSNAEGIFAARDNLDLELYIQDNIGDSETRLYETAKQMVAKGCRAIILSSGNFEEMMEKYSREFSDTTFFCNASDAGVLNFVNYSSRIYQSRYLSGVIAGMMTENNELGYIGAIPDAEGNRGINAFALGVQSVNADAKVHVIFTGSYSDRKKEIDAAEKLIGDYGCDIYTAHTNANNTLETAIKHNAYYIGSHIPAGNPVELASVDTDWEKVYTDLIREFIKGNIVNESCYWYGLDGNYVKLGSISHLVPERVKYRVDSDRKRIIKGMDVFSNMIKDNKGNMICRSGEIMPDIRLINDMNWYVRGVDVINEDDQ
ncbi:MAG: BMP family ABC transporter substrate-binding protein [Lachnospiraceae bacterium]|nr:BMP family ABC transporter substrate-binding protein [Lachnospiraceae bacterium]